MLVETIPQLPTDPTEAGNELTELFLRRGRWHRIKPWEEMSDEEKGASDQLAECYENKFGWLADMLRSEIVYSHQKIPDNRFQVHAFRFWPQDDGPDYDRDPNGFVVFPDTEERLRDGTLYLQRKDKTWEKRALADMLAEWNRILY